MEGLFESLDQLYESLDNLLATEFPHDLDLELDFLASIMNMPTIKHHEDHKEEKKEDQKEESGDHKEENDNDQKDKEEEEEDVIEIPVIVIDEDRQSRNKRKYSNLKNMDSHDEDDDFSDPEFFSYENFKKRLKLHRKTPSLTVVKKPIDYSMFFPDRFNRK